MSLNTSIGIAIIGYGVGMAVSARLAPHDRKTPAAAGVIGAVLFYLTAEFLMTAAVLCVIGLSLYFASRAWPTVQRALLTFAQESGVRFRTFQRQRSVADRIATMRDEHAHRTDSIRGLGLPRDDEEECLEMAGNRLREAIKELAATNYSMEK